jgi:hypothetical protein
MNWRQLNVRAGDCFLLVLYAIAVLFVLSLFVGFGLDAALSSLGIADSRLSLWLIVPLDALIVVPTGRWWWRRQKMLAAMTPEERTAFAKMREQYWEHLWQRWWMRYASSVLAICAAVWLLDSAKRDVDRWFAAGLFIYALIRAREISLALLAVGAAYLVFQGIAALPLSVAVIVGAMIIAGAMKK